MLRFFFLELPLSMQIAIVAAYSSYIVTIGVVSNILDFPSIIYWLVLAIALVLTFYLLSVWNFLYKCIFLPTVAA